MVFVAVEVSEAAAGGVAGPQTRLRGASGNINCKGRLRFYVSLKADSRDKWRDYRLEPAELVSSVLVRVDELANGT